MERSTSRAHRRRRDSLRAAHFSSLDMPSSSPAPAAPPDDGPARPEPRSEYLRKALQDRKEARSRPRAEDTITPTNAGAAGAATATTNSTSDSAELVRGAVRTPSPTRDLPSPEPSLADEWMRDAILDEETSNRFHSSTNSRRARRSSIATAGRSSDGTPTKEMQTRLDRLANENFDLKHRLALQQEQVKELVGKLEQALEELDQLKLADQEKEDANRRLQNELHGLDNELDAKDAEIDQLHAEKAELFALQDELTKEMDKKDEAIDEATEMIMQAEEESEYVKAELETLRRHHNALLAARSAADSDYYSTETELSPTRHARLKESTESKLSAVHSDYYSGPNTPLAASATRVPSRDESQQRGPLPSHLIPSDCVPERKLGPLGERARTIAQQKVLSSARILEVRKRLSYASEVTEATESVISDDTYTRCHPPIPTPAPLPPRGSNFRQRGSIRGLRALYKEGEHVGTVRQLRTTAATAATSSSPHAPSSPAMPSSAPPCSPPAFHPAPVRRPPSAAPPAPSNARSFLPPRPATRDGTRAVTAPFSGTSSSSAEDLLAPTNDPLASRYPPLSLNTKFHSHSYSTGHAVAQDNSPLKSPFRTTPMSGTSPHARVTRDFFFNPAAEFSGSGNSRPTQRQRPQSRTRKHVGHE